MNYQMGKSLFEQYSEWTPDQPVMRPRTAALTQPNFAWVNPTKELIEATTPITQNVITALSAKGQQERQLQAEQSQFQQWANNIPMVPTVVQQNPAQTALIIGAVVVGGLLLINTARRRRK